MKSTEMNISVLIKNITNSLSDTILNFVSLAVTGVLNKPSLVSKSLTFQIYK